jgi:hypothetical protein
MNAMKDHVPSAHPVPKRIHAMLRLRCRRALVLGFAVPLLALTAGCGEEPSTKPKLQTRETLHKTTQEVFDLKTELAKGAVLAATDIPLADPLTQGAAAYRTITAKGGKWAAETAMQVYAIDHNGEKPKTHEEFMEAIIKKGKPDGIQLPMLPYYQEYAYDTDKKELVVIEYPAKKKALDDQSDRELGRK